MAEPKQRRTSRSELLARPLCLKATGDLRGFHRHAVLLLFMRAIRRLPLSRGAGGTGGAHRHTEFTEDPSWKKRGKQFARHGSMDGGNRSLI